MFTQIPRKELNPKSRGCLEKLTVAQLVNKFHTFMKHNGSLPWPQEPATGPYPETDIQSIFSHYFFKIRFNIILVIYV
jgi:hypothetical protein